MKISILSVMLYLASTYFILGSSGMFSIIVKSSSGVVIGSFTLRGLGGIRPRSLRICRRSLAVDMSGN